MIKIKVYTSFFDTKTKTFTIEQAAENLLAKLEKRTKHKGQVNRFLVTNESSKEQFAFLVVDGRPRITQNPPCHFFDLSSIYELERVCLSVGVKPETVQPSTYDVFTKEQAMLCVIDANIDARRLWKEIVKDYPLKGIFLGNKLQKDFYVKIQKEKIILGFWDTEKETVVHYPRSILEQTESSEVKSLKAKIKMLEKKLAVMEESLKQKTKD